MEKYPGEHVFDVDGKIMLRQGGFTNLELGAGGDETPGLKVDRKIESDHRKQCGRNNHLYGSWKMKIIYQTVVLRSG
jgi:hypothetical protein